MPETTDPSTPAADPTAWCHWHKGPSGTARLVDVIDQSSAPGSPQYACAPCRDQHHLTAIDGEDDTAAYRAYIDHLWGCTTCTDTGRCPVGQPMWDTYQAALHTAAVC